MGPAQGGIALGAVIAGKYRLDSLIGQGGMGAVYRAHHLQLGEDFAVKLLRRDMIDNHETVERFTREAQSAAKLRSEHVARVQDVGVWDGAPYMVMEYLHGADLGALVEQNGALYPGVAVDLVLQACDALAEAHSLGIVHRDVKPSNLFVAFRPDETALVKVLDFGISKSAHAVDMSLTQTQSVLGTPAYMSPEQMRSARNVDPRTDIWSLGTVLYELVEGRLPFSAESFSEMCVMVAMDPPAPMRNAADLVPIIERCLAKTPEARYASIAELAAALAPFAQNPDAAKYYVTRVSRMLGVTRDTNVGAPKYESSPSIPVVVRLPLAALTSYGAVSPAAPTLQTLNTVVGDATRVDQVAAPRKKRGVWIGSIVLAGSLTAVYAMTRSPEPTPVVVPSAPAGNRIAVPTQPGPLAPPTIATPPPIAPSPPVVTKPSPCDPFGNVHGCDPKGTLRTAGASTVGKKNLKRPAVGKPTVKGPTPKPPVIIKPPVPKPSTKCDPFESRTGCK